MLGNRRIGTFVEFCKAQISSLVATSIDFAVTAFLFQVCEVYYVCSTFLGAVSGGIVNCIINYKWTFYGCRQSKVAVMLRYSLVWIGSILLNTWGTAVGARVLSGNTLVELDSVILAKVIVAVLVAVVWNFMMQKYFVYRKRK